MRSEIMASEPRETLEYLSPRWPGTDIPRQDPLPAGTIVSTGQETTNAWDPQKAVEFLGSAALAQRQAASVGLELPFGINFQAMAASIAAGAGVGALAGGVGAIVGAVVGLLMYAASLFV